jgi:hypothetical protein
MNTEYLDKLKDPRWQKKRLEIFQRDNWVCIVCGNGKNTLHVHHKKYLFNHEPWEYDNADLETLCHKCHKKMHEIDKLGETEDMKVENPKKTNPLFLVQEKICCQFKNICIQSILQGEQIKAKYFIEFRDPEILKEIREVAEKEQVYLKLPSAIYIDTYRAQEDASWMLFRKYGVKHREQLDEFDFLVTELLKERRSSALAKAIESTFENLKMRAFMELKNSVFNDLSHQIPDDLSRLKILTNISNEFKIFMENHNRMFMN